MLGATIIQVKNLSLSEKTDMYELFKQYYSAISLQAFNNDLHEKDYALLLKSAKNTIVGFSTLQVISFKLKAIAAKAIFSGDTIIHHDYWGTQVLSKTWCELAGRIKAESPELPLYWFLIVKGHRTYRYLSVFSHQYYPNRKTKTPVSIQAIMNYLSYQKFGDAYKQTLGLVHFKESQGHLHKDWSELSEKHKNHADVQFFLERNPNYKKGDELVCITELCETNMRSLAKKMFIAGMKKTSTFEKIE